jgi:hypothetical protein
MIDIVKLINSLFSNDFKQFFGILNYYSTTDTKIINLIEDIKWYYMFDDLIDVKIEGIKLIKLIYYYYYKN